MQLWTACTPATLHSPHLPSRVPVLTLPCCQRGDSGPLAAVGVPAGPASASPAVLSTLSAKRHAACSCHAKGGGRAAAARAVAPAAGEVAAPRLVHTSGGMLSEGGWASAQAMAPGVGNRVPPAEHGAVMFIRC